MFLFSFQFLGFDFFKKCLSEYSLLATLCWIQVHSKLNQSYTHSVQLSPSGGSDSAPHGLQHARPPCPSPTPRVYSDSNPSSLWCHPTISPSVIPSPAFNLSQHQGLFKWIGSLHQVAKVHMYPYTLDIVGLHYRIYFRCQTQWFDIFVDCNPFRGIVKYWLYSLCGTIYSCSLFILYMGVCIS